MAYEIIYQVLLVLGLSIVLGELFERVHIPSIAGALAAGLILGPAVTGVVSSNSQTQAVATVALFFVIFMVGFEVRAEMLPSSHPHFRQDFLLSAASFLIPLVLASVLAIGLLPFSRPADVAVALAISVPSIPIVSVFLMRYDLLQTIPGEVALTSVAASEIVALIMLAVIADSATSAAQVVVYSVAAVVGFLLISRFLGRAPNVGKGFLSRASGKLATREAAFPVLIALGLLSAWIFQLVGIGYALGAFFAGVILRQYTFGSEVYSGADRVLSRLNSGFFIPVFFGFAGTLAVVPAGGYDTLASFIVIATVSVTSGVILSWIVSRKLAQGKAGLLALSLGGRGSVNIIIGSIALADGIIGRLEFTLIILSSLGVSIGVSLAMSRVRMRKKKKKNGEEVEEEEKEL